jgi:hypothetical protein
MLTSENLSVSFEFSRRLLRKLLLVFLPSLSWLKEAESEPKRGLPGSRNRLLSELQKDFASQYAEDESLRTVDMIPFCDEPEPSTCPCIFSAAAVRVAVTLRFDLGELPGMYMSPSAMAGALDSCSPWQGAILGLSPSFPCDDWWSSLSFCVLALGVPTITALAANETSRPGEGAPAAGIGLPPCSKALNSRSSLRVFSSRI